jgi:purine-binding chemotaxis protein CheW
MKMETHGKKTEERTFCVFKVGEREFLLPTEVVREVLDVSLIFPMPGAPEYVCGVIPSRGRIIPAIDLAKIYPVEKPSYAEARLLVVDVEDENIGFLSDMVPFFVTFDDDIPVEDMIEVKTFFDTYRIRALTDVAN